jgi:hypothetical protein
MRLMEDAMKRLHILMQVLVMLAASVLGTVGTAQPPPPGPDSGGAAAYPQAPPPQPIYSREQLAQMLAPIALYPDALLSQILMASTYPLEVVEADRWIRQHSGLKGERLDAALQGQEWDPSVKALCHFPTVLAEMDRNLSHTTQLGNAFLTQQAEVMDVIQELRRKARELGTLDSCPQQRVLVRDDAIVIEPVEPAVVYVPYYDPLVVFGPWWYPAFPPFIWFPGFYASTGIVFSVGFAVGPAVIGWSAWNWHSHALVVNPLVAAPFIGGVAVGGVSAFHAWAHNPVHRLGVAYPNQATAVRFGQAGAAGTAGAALRREARGFPGPGQAVQPRTGFGPQGFPGGQAVQPRMRGGAQGFPGGQAVQPRTGVGPQGFPGGQAVQPRAGVSPQGRQAVQPGAAGQQAPQFSPFTGLSRHGGAFESRAAQRGQVPGTVPFGRGGGFAPAPGGGFPGGHGGGFAPAPGGGFPGGHGGGGQHR